MKVLLKRIAWMLRKEGFLSLVTRVLYFLLGQVMGVLAYPVCQSLNIRFIAVDVRAVGHLAGEPEGFIKEGLLGLRPPYRGVLLVERQLVANLHLLGYWKKHLWLIEAPVLILLLGPLRSSRLVRYPVEKYFCGDYTGVAFPRIQKAYQGRPPVLTLTEEDRARGREVLRSLGVPEDAWFVCVHCRESGRAGLRSGQSLRDVDVNNYVLAMEEVTARGGWVFRMGDASMKPLAPREKVIDYARLPVKSDWMDVFLCGSCRFFLGSNSGLMNLASVFGVPCVSANISGPFSNILPYGPQDIAIPKLVWSQDEERYLSFREILSSAVGNMRDDILLAERHIRVVENTPEEVRNLAVEMFQRLEGRCVYTLEDEALQEHFKGLMDPSHFSYGAASRVGRDFLKKYRGLLEEGQA